MSLGDAQRVAAGEGVRSSVFAQANIEATKIDQDKIRARYRGDRVRIELSHYDV